MTTTPEPFGFTVRRDHDEEDAWHVRLPHQCDAWDIAGGWSGVPHAKAVADLERFITEAQTALTKLNDREETGDDDYLY